MDPLLTAIYNYRKTLTVAERRASARRLKNFTVQTYPFTAEARLSSKLHRLIFSYTNHAYDVKRRFPASRYDSLSSDLLVLFTEFQLEVSQAIKDGTLSIAISSFADALADEVLKYNEDMLSDMLKDLTGKPFYGTTDWWDDLKASWISEMDSRCQALLNSYASSARDTIVDLISKNASYEEYMSAIATLDSSFSQARASFIARDLTGKINGVIQKQLQEDLGIDYYMWQTRGDERVRGNPSGMYPRAVPSHWSMDYKLCAWKNSDIVSLDYGKTWVNRTGTMPRGIPGSDWACRCSSLPYSLSLVALADKMLGGARGSK